MEKINAQDAPFIGSQYSKFTDFQWYCHTPNVVIKVLLLPKIGWSGLNNRLVILDERVFSEDFYKKGS